MAKGTLVFFLFITASSLAQKRNTSGLNCDEVLFQATSTLKNKEYLQAIRLYSKAEPICNSFDKTHYEHYISSIKGAINQEKETTRRIQYVDTICSVYSRSETKGFYDQNDDVQRAFFILKSNKPDYLKADTLFNRGIKKTGVEVGEPIMEMYYFNLYTCYKDAPEERKSNYKKRLILDHALFSKWIKEDSLTDKTKQNIDVYFNNVIKSSADLFPDLPNYLKNLPKLDDEKTTELLAFKEVLELKNSKDSIVYTAIIDSLLLFEPTSALWLTRASLFQQTQEYSKEFSALYFAKKASSNTTTADSISLLMVKSQMSLKHFSEAHRLALEIKGHFEGEALMLAAESVALNAKNCGETEEEQSLNYYYALQLLHQAKKLGVHIDDKENALKAKLPGQRTLDRMGLIGGQTIKLACWNTMITLPK